MVRATVLVSAVFALIATVSAKGSLVDIDGGDYIGVGQVNAQGAASHVVEAQGLEANDLVQNVDVASDDHDEAMMASAGSGRAFRADRSGSACTDDCHHHHDGLLGNVLKREEPSNMMAKKMMRKKMMMARKN